MSKNYNLLRNTFSIEVYEQFEKHKRNKNDNKHLVKEINEHKKVTQNKLIKLLEKEDEQVENFKKLTFKEKMMHM